MPGCRGGGKHHPGDPPPLASNGPPTPPKKQKVLAICGDLLLLKGPQIFLEKRLSGGIEVGGIGPFTHEKSHFAFATRILTGPRQG